MRRNQMRALDIVWPLRRYSHSSSAKRVPPGRTISIAAYGPIARNPFAMRVSQAASSTRDCWRSGIGVVGDKVFIVRLEFIHLLQGRTAMSMTDSYAFDLALNLDVLSEGGVLAFVLECYAAAHQCASFAPR
jgi:hypothetical protein